MQIKVPFLDLKSHHAPMLDEINRAIQEVIECSAFAGGPFVADFERDFAAYCHVPYALGVGSGTDHAQEATAGPGAKLELAFLAQEVYLVLGGHGTLDVAVNGRPVRTIRVAGTPRLYTLFQSRSTVSGKLLLHASSGVEAYDFTFG